MERGQPASEPWTHPLASSKLRVTTPCELNTGSAGRSMHAVATVWASALGGWRPFLVEAAVAVLLRSRRSRTALEARGVGGGGRLGGGCLAGGMIRVGCVSPRCMTTRRASNQRRLQGFSLAAGRCQQTRIDGGPRVHSSCVLPERCFGPRSRPSPRLHLVWSHRPPVNQHVDEPDCRKPTFVGASVVGDRDMKGSGNFAGAVWCEVKGDPLFDLIRSEDNADFALGSMRRCCQEGPDAGKCWHHPSWGWPAHNPPRRTWHSRFCAAERTSREVPGVSPF